MWWLISLVLIGIIWYLWSRPIYPIQMGGGDSNKDRRSSKDRSNKETDDRNRQRRKDRHVTFSEPGSHYKYGTSQSTYNSWWSPIDNIWWPSWNWPRWPNTRSGKCAAIASNYCGSYNYPCYVSFYDYCVSGL